MNTLYTVTREGRELMLPIHNLTREERAHLSARLRREGEALRAHASALEALVKERSREARKAIGIRAVDGK